MLISHILFLNSFSLAGFWSTRGTLRQHRAHLYALPSLFSYLSMLRMMPFPGAPGVETPVVLQCSGVVCAACTVRRRGRASERAAAPRPQHWDVVSALATSSWVFLSKSFHFSRLQFPSLWKRKGDPYLIIDKIVVMKGDEDSFAVYKALCIP